MNKERLMKMTTTEIELFLNKNIVSTNFKTENDADVREKMINDVIHLFDKTVKISVPNYTNTILVINIDKLSIYFKVSIKKTGKTVKVTRLRKKDIKTVGAFKFDDLRIQFHNPFFEQEDLEKFIVKASKGWSIGGGAEVSLKHRKENLSEMLTKDILTYEIKSQNENWNDIRKCVILSASQPKIKSEMFKQNWNSDMWDNILLETEKANMKLIDKEIEKIFKVIN